MYKRTRTKKWANYNLTHLARNFRLLTAHFFVVLVHLLLKKYFFHSLIFSFSLLHEPALDN